MDGPQTAVPMYVFDEKQLPRDPTAYGYRPVFAADGERSFLFSGDIVERHGQGRRTPSYDGQQVYVDLLMKTQLLITNGWTLCPVFNLDTNTVQVYAQKYDPADGRMFYDTFPNAVRHEHARQQQRPQ